MKFKSFLAAALAMFIFASCSNEGGNNPGPPMNGETAKVIVKLKLPKSTSTRAINEQKGGFNDGNAADDADRIQLDNFCMFALTQGGEIISKAPFTSLTPDPSTGVIEETFITKNTAKTLYLVGNYFGGDYTGLPGVGESISDLLGALQLHTSITQTGAEQNLIVAGYASIGSFDPPVGDDDPWTASATLTPIPVTTKLNITVNNKMKNYTKVDNGQYRITNVAVLYSAKQSRIFSAAVPATNGVPYALPYTNDNSQYYISGLATWPTQVIDLAASKNYTVVGENSLRVAWPADFATTSFSADDVAGDPADQTLQHTFYVYPGVTDGTKSMVVTVQATSTDPLKAPLYYSIVLDADNKMAGISDAYEYPSNGRLYQIAFNISVDANTGGGGNTDPETPTESAEIEIIINPLVWTVVSGISETWN